MKSHMKFDPYAWRLYVYIIKPILIEYFLSVLFILRIFYKQVIILNSINMEST